MLPVEHATKSSPKPVAKTASKVVAPKKTVSPTPEKPKPELAKPPAVDTFTPSASFVAGAVGDISPGSTSISAGSTGNISESPKQSNSSSNPDKPSSSSSTGNVGLTGNSGINKPANPFQLSSEGIGLEGFVSGATGISPPSEKKPLKGMAGGTAGKAAPLTKPQESLAERQKRIAEISLLADQLDVTITDKPIPDEELGKSITDGRPADLNTKMNIASQLYAAYGNRPDIIQDVLKDQNLHIVVSNSENGPLAGFAIEENDILKGYETVFRVATAPTNPFRSLNGEHFDGYLFIDGGNLTNQNNKDGFNVVAHEFGHFIDYEGVSGIEDNPEYQAIRDRLLGQASQIYDEKFDGNTPEQGNAFWNEESISPEFRNYAFKNEGEFFAQSLESYIENPSALRELDPTLFTIFNEQFQNYDTTKSISSGSK